MEENKYPIAKEKYNDPYIVSLLIKRVKECIGVSYTRDFIYLHAEDIAKKANLRSKEIEKKNGINRFVITAEHAYNKFRRPHGKTKVPQIFFASEPFLTKFTLLVDLGTWDQFCKSVTSVIKSSPKTISPTPNAEERHLAYAEWYKGLKEEIDHAISLEPSIILDSDRESNNTTKEANDLGQFHISQEGSGGRHKKEEEDTRVLLDADDKLEKFEESTESITQDFPNDSVGERVVIFPNKVPFILGKERKKALKRWALYLINPEKPLAITGMGGIGKTNFARNLIAHEVVLDTYKYRFEVLCEAETSYEMFLSKLGEQILTRKIGENDENTEHLILKHLSDLPGKKLILFDNFDTCYDNYFDEANEIIEVLKEIATIVFTIRSYIGPQILDCTPYPIPKISKDEAVELFNYHSNKKFARDQKDLKYIHYFVGDKAAGCLPLAVKLLAKQAERVSQLSDLVEEWEQNRIRMLKFDGVKSNKDRNLIISIAFSYNSPRLKEEDRALLKALCTIPASIKQGRKLIRSVIQDSFNMVNRIVDVALIEESARGDLDIHPMIREYMLIQDIPTEPYLSLFVDHYLDMLIEYGEYSAFGFQEQKIMESQWTNLLWAVETQVDSERWIVAICCFAYFAIVFGGLEHSSLLGLYKRALLLIENKNEWTYLKAYVILNLGFLQYSEISGENEIQEALMFFEQEGWHLGQANCKLHLGVRAVENFNFIEARLQFAEAADLYFRSLRPSLEYERDYQKYLDELESIETPMDYADFVKICLSETHLTHEVYLRSRLDEYEREISIQGLNPNTIKTSVQEKRLKSLYEQTVSLNDFYVEWIKCFITFHDIKGYFNGLTGTALSSLSLIHARRLYGIKLRQVVSETNLLKQEIKSGNLATAIDNFLSILFLAEKQHKRDIEYCTQPRLVYFEKFATDPAENWRSIYL